VKSRSLLLVLALLTACGSDPVWKHPTKDPYEAKEELADCERFFGGVDKDLENCMKQKGWTQVK
jgi:hypothetical protein